MTTKAPITTHILDLVRGQPAAGINVSLHQGDSMIATAVTDADGRVMHWDQVLELIPGKYRLAFDVEPYFAGQGSGSFYEDVHISFRVQAVDEHYHVPLLLSPYGYSTYRGS